MRNIIYLTFGFIFLNGGYPKIIQFEKASNRSSGTIRGPSLGVDVECGVSKVGQNRIVNGVDAIPHEFPWIVSIQITTGKQNSHICGGSVIHPSWILTAAHCTYSFNTYYLRVVAGAHSLNKQEESQQIRSVQEEYKNNYDKFYFKNDISLLKLTQPLDLNGDYVAPICLPDSNQKFDVEDAIFAGWGVTSEGSEIPYTKALQKVTLPIIPFDQCVKKYEPTIYSALTHSCQVCTNSRDNQGTCQGDSGGPGIVSDNGKYYLLGLVSWGEGCAKFESPGVNTDVSCYIDWIQNTVMNN